MSVCVTSFDNPDGTWTYVHDDAPGGSHGGTLDPASVAYGQNPDGTDNVNVISVPCPFPECGSVSYWPPGGGAHAQLGQSLHVVLAYSTPTIAARGVEAAVDASQDVKARVVATDGEERWVLDDAALARLKELATR
jgi:hypothetical protein